MVEQLELLVSAESVYGSSSSERLIVRESMRARRMFLHVQPPLGVELVVPRGTRPHAVQAFVEAHRAWIDAAHAEIAREYVGDRSSHPPMVHLPALRQALRVQYRIDPNARRRWVMEDHLLSIACRLPGCEDAGGALRDWLMHEARNALPPMVARTADVVGSRPARVQVRLQKTRWGSCSATGTVSVNAAILFLEPELVRYLIVHELCHLTHMNHSRAYWRHVAKFEPDCRRLDRRLSMSWQRIPWWAMPRRAE